jgi:Cof subfamily protein (haloacid dehalogenase superfamily)
VLSDLGIRLVATDIDGTLLNNHRELSPLTLAVLQRLLDQKVAVVLVTGLNPWPAKRYAQQIGHGIKALCLNGTFLIENGKLQPGYFIDCDAALQAAQFIMDCGYVPIVYGADNVSRYIPGVPEAMVQVTVLIKDRPYQPYVPVTEIDALFQVQPAQVSVCDSDIRAALLFPELKQAVGEYTYVVYQPAGQSGRSWVEVNHPQARKDIALLDLAGEMGISSDEIIYFGDSLNDIPVFESIAYPVAVGNARSEVLDLAWKTTFTNNAHGVARFLIDLFDLDL